MNGLGLTTNIDITLRFSALFLRQFLGTNLCKVLGKTLSFALLFTGCAVSANEIVRFPDASFNTPYSNVAGLAVSQANNTVSYGQGDKQQFILHWTAKGTPKGQIVLIHGGCWLSAFDITHSFALSTGLAQVGYEVYSIEYRRSGNGGEWPVAFNDIRDAVRRIVELIEDERATINLLGHSAGGHLALMVATDIDEVLPTEMSLNVIGLAAIVDITNYSIGQNSCQSATPKFMQGTSQQRPLECYLANPLNIPLISPQISAITLLHGTQDAIVPVQQGKHPQATQVLLDGAGHFDWIHPGSEAFQQILVYLK